MFKREYIAELKAAGYRPRAWVTYVRRHADLALHTVIARPGPARSVVAHGAALCAILFALSFVLALNEGLELGRRLFLWGSLWVGVLCAWVLAHLGLLTDLAGRPLARFGWPNALTLLRGATVPPLLVLAAAGSLKLLAIVLVVGALSDVLDGIVARRIGPLSRLGVIMDAMVDIAWNTGAFWAFVSAGLLPPWILALVGLRYGLLLAGATVLYLRRTTLVIRPTRFGKATGALISIGLGLVLANRLLADGGWFTARTTAAVAGMLAAALALLACATVAHVLFLGAVARRAGSPPPLALVVSEPVSRKRGR
jgi:cardiolipin synthase